PDQSADAGMQPGSPIAVYPPEHPVTLPMTRTPVYRLSPFLDGLSLSVVGYLQGQGARWAEVTNDRSSDKPQARMGRGLQEK
ncbi:MAG: hypothetical protein LBF06_02980, partial [Pseudomonas sp.]|nr:hypothetical protein [Pseudomonas sp.]